jgi:hypothetical protein
MKKLTKLAAIAIACSAQLVFAGSTTSRTLVTTAGMKTEADARSDLQAQAKSSCMANPGESTNYSIDSSTLSCKQFGISVKQWACRAEVSCTRSGPNVGQKSNSKGGATRM